MSSNAISVAAQRKKQDEKNLTLVRELQAKPANKFCFECGQRGPTYVNVTNGSFCCMHCSGLLRGLNPPQRVKSISLSTFTDEDIQKLQSAGNEVNARIWLGLYDKKVKFEPRVDDEVRQHLIQKYENRRWYVSPDDLEQQKKLMEEHAVNRSTTLFVPTGSDIAPASAATATLQRRDSIKSHQSNQSAPPNLHPKDKQDPFDLLTGDISSTPNFAPPPKVPQPNPIAATFNPPFSSSIQPIVSVPPGTGSSKVPCDSSSLRHRVLPQTQFNSTDAIFTSNAGSNAFSTSSLAQNSFAEFDAQFDALKMNDTTNSKAPPVIPPFSSSSFSIQTQCTAQLPQRPASTTLQSTLANSASYLQTAKNNTSADDKDSYSPPNYSAFNLEETTQSVIWDTPASTGNNTGSSSAFGGLTSTGMSAFNTTLSASGGANFGKSNTLDGFQTANDLVTDGSNIFQSNQFHTVSDFSSTSGIPSFAQFPAVNNSGNEKSSADKSWNPFL